MPLLKALQNTMPETKSNNDWSQLYSEWVKSLRGVALSTKTAIEAFNELFATWEQEQLRKEARRQKERLRQQKRRPLKRLRAKERQKERQKKKRCS